MAELVDIDQYCKLLCEITDLDCVQVKRIVVLYLSSVFSGIISFDKASDAIEDELTQKMRDKKKNLGKKRRLMPTIAN